MKPGILADDVLRLEAPQRDLAFVGQAGVYAPLHSLVGAYLVALTE